MSQPGYQRVQIEFHGRPLTVETGRMAKQAGGAALVQLGESVVLVTATALATAREGIDFFPLTCDYQEKTFAAGKIPGGFFKREGRPAEKEILTSLVLSDIPWDGPIAAVRIGRIDGRFVINPTTSQLATSDMNVIVAGSRDAIVMVEGGARMVPEALLLEALFAAHEALQPLIALQESLQRLVGKPKRSVTAPAVDPALERQVREATLPSLRAALAKPGKQERYDALDQARDQVVARLGEGTPERLKQVAAFFDHLKKDVVREAIVQQKRRLDGRGLADVRPITCEVKFLRSPGRREIGHGALAERALAPILPSEEAFPYTIRIVSEILESNGSSSMATVCGGSLSLMDAGVPLAAPVAGIAMGLVKE